MYKILIVEDDDFIRDILTYSLRKEGFITYEASDGLQAEEIINNTPFDLALLDVMLPDTDGFSICKRITKLSLAPVIMLTAKDDISDKLMGLDIGADDYIVKPFDIREVIARIRIVLKRGGSNNRSQEGVIQIKEDIKVYKDSHEVEVKDMRIKLKRKEFKLLLALIENRNIVLSRDKLLDIVWGYDFIGDTRTVDVHIQRLRKKLGETKDDSIIKTVFGVGYKMI